MNKVGNRSTVNMRAIFSISLKVNLDLPYISASAWNRSVEHLLESKLETEILFFLSFSAIDTECLTPSVYGCDRVGLYRVARKSKPLSRIIIKSY